MLPGGKPAVSPTILWPARPDPRAQARLGIYLQEHFPFRHLAEVLAGPSSPPWPQKQIDGGKGSCKPSYVLVRIGIV